MTEKINPGLLQHVTMNSQNADQIQQMHGEVNVLRWIIG